MLLRMMLVLAVVVLTGCLNGTGVGRNEPPTITGEITNLNGGVLVEEQRGLEAGGNKIVFQLTDATQIFVQEGDQRRAISARELAVGQRVAVWSTGELAESFPAQGTAVQIVVMAR